MIIEGAEGKIIAMPRDESQRFQHFFCSPYRHRV